MNLEEFAISEGMFEFLLQRFHFGSDLFLHSYRGVHLFVLHIILCGIFLMPSTLTDFRVMLVNIE